MKPTIEFELNGKPVTTMADPSTPLLFVLRNEFQLKGARFGCGEEQCGACMVLVDDQPVYACSREFGTLAGKAVQTIEGLVQDGSPHPVQTAFIEEQAAQCGYCTSGLIMSSVALLKRCPAPDRSAIIEALDPHLCRCGVHNRVIRAVEKAAAIMRKST